MRQEMDADMDTDTHADTDTDTEMGAALDPGPALSAAHAAVLADPAFLPGFGLERARLLLAVGSHVSGVADGDSDTDFLAVYGEGAEVPGSVPLPGAISLSSSLSANWTGELAGREVNVEAIGEARLLELGALLAPQLSATSSPMLQMLDIRLLDRIRTGIALPIGDQPADAEYLAALRRRLHVDRLPLLLIVLYLGSAAHYLAKAQRRLEDRHTVHLALEAVAENALFITLCLYGIAPYAMKKAPRLLSQVEREHPGTPFTTADLDELWFGPDDVTRLAAARRVLDRIRARIDELAARGDPMCVEAVRGLSAYAGPPAEAGGGGGGQHA